MKGVRLHYGSVLWAFRKLLEQAETTQVDLHANLAIKGRRR